MTSAENPEQPLHWPNMRKETSYQKVCPLRESPAEEAKMVALRTEVFEQAVCREVDEHDNEFDDIEILDSYVPQDERR